MDAKKIEILEQLYFTKGVVTPACEAIGLSRSTFYLWLKDDEEFAAAVDELQNVALDFAESKLFQLVSEGDTTATIFLLKTRGKKRGYVERSELDATVSMAVNWNETKTYDPNHQTDTSA